MNKTIFKIISFLAVTVALVTVFFLQPLTIKTDIMALLPASKENELKQAAFAHLSTESMGRINILFAAKDSSRSKEAGLYFNSLIKNSIENITYEISTENEKQLLNLLAEYNYHLVSDNYKELLRNNEHDTIARTALSMLYSPAGVNLAGFEKDPYMLLSEYMLENRLFKNGFSLKNSVLTSEYNNATYTFMSLQIDAAIVFSPGRLSAIMQNLHAAKDKTLNQFDDVQISLTGIPVHTYHASSNSVKEINTISIISFLTILLLSLVTLRSPLSFVAAMFSISTGFGMAFVITHTVFAEIHILTLVFGTSLIGLSIDYCLHYFIERACEENSQKALDKIIKAITISLVTTLIGFVTLFTSGMLLMKQMALFSITGLVYAYLTIIIFYPLLFKKRTFAVSANTVKIEQFVTGCMQRLITGALPVKCLVFFIVVIIGIIQIQTSDSIKYLYKPEAALLQDEILFSKVNKQNLSLQFFFVTGKNTEEILQQEEHLRLKLDKAIIKGQLTGYKSISQLIPSKAAQEEAHLLTSALFKASMPFIQETTGIKDSLVQKMTEHKDLQKGKYLVPETLLDFKELTILNNFWVQGKGAILLLEGVTNSAELEQYQDANVYFLDKLNDYTTALSEYRHKATITVFIAFALILMLLLYRYGIRQGLVTIMPSMLSLLIILAVFGYFGIPVTFFHIIGLFLVLCFGLDYTVFQVETKGKLKYSGLAVMLSCITTLASFGLMAFTSFEVTKSLGLTLFMGILLSYLFSPLPKFFMVKGSKTR